VEAKSEKTQTFHLKHFVTVAQKEFKFCWLFGLLTQN